MGSFKGYIRTRGKRSLLRKHLPDEFWLLLIVVGAAFLLFWVWK